MNRRQFIQAAGVGGSGVLAGCLGLSSGRQPEATPPADCPDGFWRWVSLESVDRLPGDHQVEFNISVTQPWITPERTARIESTITNEAETKRVFNPLPLDENSSEDEAIRIFTRSDPNGPIKPNCSKPEEGKAADPGGSSGDQPGTEILGPGESVTEIGFLMDNLEVNGCYPTDVYDFQRTQVVTELQNGEEKGEASHEILFSLGIQGENR